MPAEEKLAIAATKQWVRTFAVGLNLCPFAGPVWRKGLIRFCASRCRTTKSIDRMLLTEILRLQKCKPSSIATTLLVLTRGLRRFSDFLAYCEHAERIMAEIGVDQTFMLATFHPNYRFRRTKPSDPANWTNRTPFPTLHLIRHDDINEARQNYPGVEKIPARNVQLMRKMANLRLRGLVRETSRRIRRRNSRGER